jgi:hypothetical protein
MFRPLRSTVVRLSAVAAVFAATLIGAAAPAWAYRNSNPSLGVWDAPSRYFPGRYFEQKAQFYLKKQDYREALRLFELSGYWADKVAQYNAGIMHFNGIGVPTDKVRGAAWPGIAAESGDDLANVAVQAAWAELTPAQRSEAESTFGVLRRTYGDEAALPRALNKYRQDASVSLFGFGVAGPGTVYTVAGSGHGLEEDSVNFVHRMDAQRDALIAQIHGRVSVGAVRPLDVPQSAKRDPSHTVLESDVQQP